MHRTTCFCGETLAADDLAALVPVALTHFDRTHAELGLREHHIRDYLAAEVRLTGPTDRLTELGEVTVREVGPDLLDDLLEFFDHRAFAGNPAWASCYCLCHHVGAGDAQQWLDRTAAMNRADLIERVQAGTTTGVVAYVDGQLAAWCNASPRSAFRDYAGRDAHDDDTVGAVACFVIAPPYRKHGLATRLLAAACDSFARKGFALVEAYPQEDPPEDPPDDAKAYHGPLPLYLHAGFTPVATRGKTVVVQLPLAPVSHRSPTRTP